MNDNCKKIMIVDDSDIDREILRNILEHDYEVLEETNGYSALDHIISQKINIDAVMLDISMPIVDGFAVLNILKLNDIKNLPIVMITSEATRENVVRAVEFGITEFISKPFQPDDVLGRIRTILDLPEEDITVEIEEEEDVKGDILSNRDIDKSNEYFERLKELFQDFLRSRELNDEHYCRVSDIVREILMTYSMDNPDKKLSLDHINLISKAAYLYNFGKIMLDSSCYMEPEVGSPEVSVYENHTIEGAKLIRLNAAPSCSYFVDICSDICMHHHERYNGSGFPHQLKGSENSFNANLCSLVAAFDKIFIERSMFNENQFDFVISQIDVTATKFDPALISLFNRCRTQILAVYKKGDKFIRI